MSSFGDRVDVQSMDLVGACIKALRQLFPETFTEGRVDFDSLRLLLGDHIDDRVERYGLSWFGKTLARQIAQTPSTGTLRPMIDESIEYTTTQNIFIEGENLEVLKILQKSYHRGVKMIYIDPPYNTGQDFIYSDRYQDSLDEYLIRTNQVNEEGLRVAANTESNGRYHTNWLNMMYPRLKLARHLLRDDGVIFVSIDDREVHNLRHLLDEIFGPENFEGHVHWRRRHNQPNDRKKMIGIVAEHILVYARSSDRLRESGVGKIGLTGKFNNPDNDPRGAWSTKPWKVGTGQSGSSYEIISPTGERFFEQWMGDQSRFEALRLDGRIAWPLKGGLPRKKYYESERAEEGQCANNWWPHKSFGHNQGGSDRLAQLLGSKGVFENPKPIELIMQMMRIANVGCGDLVLDYFAGSGSVGDAVMQLNAEDGQERRFLLVQLPEQVPEGSRAERAGYKTISQVCRHRLRSASENQQEQSAGFRVFKLDSSNIEAWDGSHDALNMSLLNAINRVKPGRGDEDVLYEVMLRFGLDLSSSIEELVVRGKRVFVVNSGAVVACFESGVELELVEEIILLLANFGHGMKCVVFRDDAFRDDVIKVNAMQLLKRAGVDDVKSV